MNGETPKIELPSFLKDKAGSGEQEAAEKIRAALEKELGTPLDGFLVIALPKEGQVQMSAIIPPDPYQCVRLARASAKATGAFLG